MSKSSQSLKLRPDSAADGPLYIKRSANPVSVCYACSEIAYQIQPLGIVGRGTSRFWILIRVKQEPAAEWLIPAKNEVFLCVCRSQTFGGSEES